MTRGRLPKPSHLKLVAGNPGKRPIKDWVKPTTRSIALAPPAHLDQIGKTEWRRLAKELTTLGTLTNLDRAAFTAYCQCWSTYVRAQDEIERQAKDRRTLGGMISITAAGNAIQNPIVGIRNTALRDLLRYAAEFGFTPSSRARVQDAAPATAARQAASQGPSESEFFDDE